MLAVLAALVAANLAVDGGLPDPRPSSAPGSRFSAERAASVLRQLADRPRPLGGAASDRARDLLAAKLKRLGFEVRVDHAVGGTAWEGDAVFGRVDDVVATLPGRRSTGRVVLAAHYDSVPGGPGASDDAAQVAGIVETARALAADRAHRNDVTLVLTDGEEEGLLGAEAYARAHPSRGADVVLNWEARGTGGPSLMFETSAGNARLISVYADAAPHTTGDSSMVDAYRYLPNNTDLTEFKQHGYLGLNSANIEGAAWYHTPGDNLSHVDLGTLQEHGDNMVALARAFADTDLSTMRARSDTVYTHLFGVMIRYPAWWGWVLAASAVALCAAAVIVARRRRMLSLPRWSLAWISGLLPLGVAVAAGQVLWTVLTGLRPGYGDSGGMLYRPVGYEAAVALLSCAAVLAWYWLLRKRLGPAAMALGGVSWLVLSAVAGSALVSVHTAVGFTLAAVGVAAGTLVAVAVPRAAWRTSTVAFALGAVPACVLLASMATELFSTFGMGLAGVSGFVLALLGVALVPLVEPWCGETGAPRRRFAWGVPLVAVAAAIAVAAAGVTIDGYDHQHPRRSNLAYVLNADTGRASWVTTDTARSPWTASFAPHAGVADRVPSGYVDDGLTAWGAAKPVDVPAPTARVKRDGGKLRVHIDSPRHAYAITLRVATGVTAVAASVHGSASVTKTLHPKDSGTWPSTIRFVDPPSGGVDLTIGLAENAHPKLVVLDESPGLGSVPGFRDRPDAEMRSPYRSSDTVTVVRDVAW